MGLYDFEFGAGKNLGMEMNLTREIQELEIEVENLELDFNEGVVTVGGIVSSQEDRERIIPAFGMKNWPEKLACPQPGRFGENRAAGTTK